MGSLQPPPASRQLLQPPYANPDSAEPQQKRFRVLDDIMENPHAPSA